MTDEQTETSEDIARDAEFSNRELMDVFASILYMQLRSGVPGDVQKMSVECGIQLDRVRFVALLSPDLTYDLDRDEIGLAEPMAKEGESESPEGTDASPAGVMDEADRPGAVLVCQSCGKAHRETIAQLRAELEGCQVERDAFATEATAKKGIIANLDKQNTELQAELDREFGFRRHLEYRHSALEERLDRILAVAKVAVP